MMNKPALPVKAVISVTERCNSRCSFCNIWKTEHPIDLDIGLIDKLPVTLKNVDITGGEPFLHSGIESIIAGLLKRGCKVIINTNGLVDLKKYEKLYQSKNIGIRFSLDGIRDAHDSLRGVKGNYETVIKQIGYLKSRGFKDMGISSTFSDLNIDQAISLFRLSKELNVDFTFVVAGNSELYYKKNDNVIKNIDKITKILGDIIQEEVKVFKIKNLGKAIYMNELKEFIKGNIKKIRCPAGEGFFFMQPNGDVYACNMRNLVMGNLHKESFEKIWFSEAAGGIRGVTRSCDMPCWTMCNAKELILGNKLKYLFRFCGNFICDRLS